MAEDEDPNIISRMERKKAESEKQDIDTTMDYGKYAVGGESKEVPASPDKNLIKDQNRHKEKNDDIPD